MRLLRDFIELFFPRVCCVCGTPLVGDEHDICTRCLLELPEAYTATGSDSMLERRLRGRVPIRKASALLYYKQGTGAQTILHQIKYYGNERLAITMGRQMGITLMNSGLFDDVDIIVPVPLHRSKERKRGYNQSLLLCQGIAQRFPRPISTGNLVRIKKTDTQTKKNREERLDNMRGVFAVTNPEAFIGKHILLVDDVITTGATTEACYEAMKHIEGISFSIATLAVSGDN